MANFKFKNIISNKSMAASSTLIFYYENIYLFSSWIVGIS